MEGNQAYDAGGGIATDAGAQVMVESSTINANNSAVGGAGIDLFGGSTLTLTNSVVSNNNATGVASDIGESGPNSTINADNSFIETNATIDSGANNQVNAGNPILDGILDFNGGAVTTLLPLPGSPLIGAGDATLLPADIFDVDRDGDTTEKLPLDANLNGRAIAGLDIGASEFNQNLVVDTIVDEQDGDFGPGDLSPAGGPHACRRGRPDHIRCQSRRSDDRAGSRPA